jgi:hypothetical protein
MNQQTFSNWAGGYDPNGGESQPVLGPSPMFRDAKDRRLAAFGATPDTQYPDGYLGTMSSNRRQDKLLDSVKRQNHRSYSRGVHKGERVNPGDYLWPDEMNLFTGLELQAQGLKFAPPERNRLDSQMTAKQAPVVFPEDLTALNKNRLICRGAQC